MMKTIQSFTVNHDNLTPGIYLSRIDGDVITYDVRMKVPNGGDYLPVAAMHTIEHLFATYARSSAFEDQVIYVGPMGCRTGFYFLLRDSIGKADVIRLIQEAFAFMAAYEGEIPGATKKQCGNYLEHDLTSARAESAAFCRVIQNWTVDQMTYLP